MRVLKVLSGPAKFYLDRPEKLKFILAPVLARSEAEQNLFYELFDRYYAEVSTPLTPDKTPLPWWKRLPGRVWWWVAGAIAIGAAGYGLYRLVPDRPGQFSIAFEHNPPEAAVGDTIFFKNRSENIDTNRFRFSWEWIDDSTGVVEKTGRSFDWQVIVDSIGSGSNKKVVLTAGNRRSGKALGSAETKIGLRCQNPPKIRPIQVTNTGKNRYRFDASVESEGELQYRWDFGDGNTSEEKTPEHVFDADGTFFVRLTVERPDAEAPCTGFEQYQLTIGEETALLEMKPLFKDPFEPAATLRSLPFLLLGLLGWAVLYFLFSRRRSREEQKQAEHPAAARFQVTDKAPYFIPFPNQNGAIAVESPQFRLADALRLRQEGLRKVVDVPASVRATIEKGGFPQLRFSFTTQPTDYLFLIDEQSSHSHQAHLFHYLTGQMRSQDVHAEVFHYQGDFHRFWNRYHPDGLNLELLHRLYPNHRLVVLGDAHSLLDPHAPGQPALRKPYAALFRQWKQRLLLTPLPPESWTYREGLLHDLFAVFPADMKGLGQSAIFVEAGLEREDLPTSFLNWQDTMRRSRRDTDINYRRWRTADDHRDYLKDHPEVFRWLCALAVYPTPNWPMTLAIGKALASFGVTVTFDNLLLLARIPWLQKGDLHPRLRQELLDRLDPVMERAARQTIRQELTAVAAEVGNGSASLDLQTGLALQNFALDPENTDCQDEIRYLLDQGMLHKKQIAELNRAVQQQAVQQTTGSNIGAPSPEYDIHQFLKDKEEKPQAAPPPVFSREFIRAVVASSFFLVLYIGLLGSLDGSKRLLKIAPEDTLFTRSAVDSSVWYNNQGVHFWTALKDSSISAQSDFLRYQFLMNGAALAVQRFEKAIDARRPDWGPSTTIVDSAALENRFAVYPLAEANLGRVYYNLGVEGYLAFLEGEKGGRQEQSSNIGRLPRQSSSDPDPEDHLSYFHRAAKSDSLRLDALHGLGLSHFYLNNRDSAQFYFDRILASSDSLNAFFDTLGLSPNLQDLIETSQYPRLLDIRTEETGPEALNLSVDFFSNTDLYGPLTMIIDVGELNAFFGPQLDNEVSQTTREITGFDPKNQVLFTYLIKDLPKGTGRYSKEVALRPYTLSGMRKTPFSTQAIRVTLLTLDGKVLDERSIRYQKDWKPGVLEVKNSAVKIKRPVITKPETKLDPIAPTVEIFEQAGRQGLRSNPSGKIVVEPIYNLIEPDPATGLYRVQLGQQEQAQQRSGSSLLFGYLDAAGREVIPVEYRSLGFAQNSLIAAEKDLSGYLDTRGRTVIPFQYEQAGDFRNGSAQVTQIIDGRRYIFTIDTQGNCIRNCPPPSEREAWIEAIQQNTEGAYYSFLENFPKGEYASEAQKRIDDLAKERLVQEKDLGAADFQSISFAGKSYRTVQLNGKTWLAENLNYETKDSWCYEDDPKNCEKYGRLYSLNAATQACSELGRGWRLPTLADWKGLESAFGISGKIRTADSEAVYQALIDGGGSGFDALPGGQQNRDGSFTNLGSLGIYWSADKKMPAWVFDANTRKTASMTRIGMLTGASCRCVRD